MALSEAEREWLERREEYLRFYCQHCQFFKPYDTPHVNPGWCQGDCWCCPVVGKDIQYSFRDAAEFEARVALKLTDYDVSYKPLCLYYGCNYMGNCRECRLMHARLAVEAEMEEPMILPQVKDNRI